MSRRAQPDVFIWFVNTILLLSVLIEFSEIYFDFGFGDDFSSFLKMHIPPIRSILHDRLSSINSVHLA